MFTSLYPPYDFLLILSNKTVYKGYLFCYFYTMTEKTHNEELNEKKATKVPVENEEESDL